MANSLCPRPGSSPLSELGRLASDRHARALLAQINCMRSRADFCDVQPRVEEAVFSVHKLVLVASSPYFAVLFAGGMQEANQKLVHIHGIQPDIFQLLLEFTYTELQHLQYLPLPALDSRDWLQWPKSRVRLLFELERWGLCDESNFRSLLQLLRVLTRHDLLPYVGQKRGRAAAIELEEEEQDGGSGDMGGSGDQFLQKDFSEACERYQAEGLWSLTGQELIREYLELEGCLSALEDQNNRLEGRKMARSSEVMENRVKELEQEIDRLGAEDLRLLMGNELYKQEERLSESAG